MIFKVLMLKSFTIQTSWQNYFSVWYYNAFYAMPACNTCNFTASCLPISCDLQHSTPAHGDCQLGQT
jgi:hypothetical protein